MSCNAKRSPTPIGALAAAEQVLWPPTAAVRGVAARCYEFHGLVGKKLSHVMLKAADHRGRAWCDSAWSDLDRWFRASAVAIEFFFEAHTSRSHVRRSWC